MCTHESCILRTSLCGRKRESVLAEWTVVEKSGVATQIRSRNRIGLFGRITYILWSTYQIMGLEFGYGLGRCQASKTTRLVGQPPLCVVRPYLIKEFIKRVLILNLNIHHALKEITHNILKITSQYKDYITIYIKGQQAYHKSTSQGQQAHQQGINQAYSSCSSIKSNARSCNYA